ncbi:molybdopterin-dependent oxidoreductase [Nocardioides sp.]|uniref:molybdopterin-dependent oxidoreductase n=1 Tax=Nocardioides sp. TaxID=35761 RepID=UPI0035669B5F
MRNRLIYATFGILSTLVGVALGHLVAALTTPAASPVLAVGSKVITLTPTAMKEWAIRQFGDADKAILIGSVFLGVLVFAAIGGLLARRRVAVGAGLLVFLVAIAAYTALTRSGAGIVDLLPSLAAAVAGVASLWWLDRLARPQLGAHTRAAAVSVAAASVAGDSGAGDSVAGDDVSDSTSAGTSGGTSGASAGVSASRRGLLIGSGVLAAAAAAMGGAGHWISSYRTRLVDIALPSAARPIPPLPTGLESRVPGISPFQTSRDNFYRVDTRLTLPIVDVNSWTLTIDGDVDQEVTFTFDDLMGMELIERDITLTCVSNDIGGKYVGSARWLGVRLMDLLEMAGIENTKSDQILSTDVDGMTIGTPYDLATDGRDAMIAIGMNGKSLPIEHGFPARMVIPGLYGFISATKWISRITLTTYAETDSYWTERDWDTRTPIKISSRIDTPKPLARVEAGRTTIGGVAWAQHQGGIAKVQVRVDGGGWQDARLGPTAGEDYWRQWYLPWTAEPGQHNLAVRAVNGEGEVQTAARATPFPNGSSGIQEVVVTVV